ncbi:MAG: hypothetical protein ABIH41_06800, partial [Nanoarchaeota archaeon]
ADTTTTAFLREWYGQKTIRITTEHIETATGTCLRIPAAHHIALHQRQHLYNAQAHEVGPYMHAVVSTSRAPIRHYQTGPKKGSLIPPMAAPNGRVYK